ncbi:MAG: hypothetical protein ACI8RD_003336 [Bacillariaceae sp.]|jgi:hypothetical protein
MKRTLMDCIKYLEGYLLLGRLTSPGRCRISIAPGIRYIDLSYQSEENQIAEVI